MSNIPTTFIRVALLLIPSTWECIPTESPQDEFDFEYTYAPTTTTIYVTPFPPTAATTTVVAPVTTTTTVLTMTTTTPSTTTTTGSSTTTTTPTTTSTTSTTTTSTTTTTTTTGICSTTGGYVWIKFGDFCYYVHATGTTRPNAKNACQPGGGRNPDGLPDGTLAWITSQEEMDFIQSLAVAKSLNTDYWIGLINNPGAPGTTPGVFDASNYHWEGMYSPIVWSTWAPNEPSDPGASAGSCTAVSWANAPTWDDQSCTTSHPYVCKARAL